ncbi:30S ribosomal protein S7 [Candidatus Dojkabacteria bacterium]|uniref:Small ribosomal subunit protein uS7 n=1 Tax=Candidatus Dojkabacteria bacterium TaxID=2099670 RepID=A0A955I7I0_9BACT|nr:30S ribosomal protein S7 [Candidatus Dojkabacteria bacterium]
MRGKQITPRKILPDEKYNSEIVTKLINYAMQDGKKATARTAVYNALEDLSAKTKSDPVEALEKAIDNVRPAKEIRARRVGGANYQIPVPVAERRQLYLALSWLIDASRKHRGGKPFWQSLSGELFAAYNNDGDAIRKKEDMQRMAESNRAFAQFA